MYLNKPVNEPKWRNSKQKQWHSDARDHQCSRDSKELCEQNVQDEWQGIVDSPDVSRKPVEDPSDRSNLEEGRLCLQ